MLKRFEQSEVCLFASFLCFKLCLLELVHRVGRDPLRHCSPSPLSPLNPIFSWYRLYSDREFIKTFTAVPNHKFEPLVFSLCGHITKSLVHGEKPDGRPMCFKCVVWVFACYIPVCISECPLIISKGCLSVCWKEPYPGHYINYKSNSLEDFVNSFLPVHSKSCKGGYFMPFCTLTYSFVGNTDCAIVGKNIFFRFDGSCYFSVLLCLDQLCLWWLLMILG